MLWRYLSTALVFVACAASVACTLGAQSDSADPEADPPTFASETNVRRNGTTGAVERADGELDQAMRADDNYGALAERDDYAGMAMAFIDRYRRAFRFEKPLSELHVVRVNADRLGYHQVRLGQRYSGLRVLDAELVVHFDPDGRLYSVQGHYLPTPSDVVVTPSLLEEEARRAVAAEIGPDFEIGGSELVLLLPESGNGARSAYRFEARRGLVERREVLVDALTGRPVRNIPLNPNIR